MKLTSVLVLATMVHSATAALWWSSLTNPFSDTEVGPDGRLESMRAASPNLKGGAVDVQAALKDSKIIPEVIEDFIPSASISVSYNGKDVIMGTQVKPDDGKAAPILTFKGLDKAKSYSLIMSDPGVLDTASTKSDVWQWGHWFVSNIPGETGDVKEGRTILAYSGPNPPQGNHRYAVLLFEQERENVKAALIPDTERGNFHVQSLANKYGLTPVAGFYYMSTN